jgi:hypothetical protein
VASRKDRQLPNWLRSGVFRPRCRCSLFVL